MDGVSVFRLLWVNGQEYPITGTRGDILKIDTDYGQGIEFYDDHHPMRIREVAQVEYALRLAEVHAKATAFRAEQAAQAKPPRCEFCGVTEGFYAHRHT